MRNAVKSICLGRFLLVVPQYARVTASYVTAGARVSTEEGVSRGMFTDIVESRQQELRREQHGQGGPMLVERYAIAPTHEVLVSWAGPVSQRMYRYEEFQYFPDHRILFRFDGNGTATPGARTAAREAQTRISGIMRVRGTDEIPIDTGFCIDRGIVPGNRLNREEVEAGVELRGAQATRLDFTSFVTRNPEPSLLERSRSIAEGAAESAAEGTFSIRKASRVAAGLPGEELILQENDGHQTRYWFFWEFPGTPDSLAAPFLKLAMSLSPGALGAGSDFADLSRAQAFWDRVVDSLRLRPGAI